MHGCAPVGELRKLKLEYDEQITALRRDGQTDTAHFERVLREQFEAYDNLLDEQDQSKFLLAAPSAALAVIDSWKTLAEMQACRLYAVCVMGNHAHALIAGLDKENRGPVGNLVRRHKTFTSRTIKALLQNSAEVWDAGFYDRYVRTGRFWEVLQYVLDNPVKAGLVSHWTEWPHVFVDQRCLDRLAS